MAKKSRTRKSTAKRRPKSSTRQSQSRPGHPGTATTSWPFKRLAVARLDLDARNPRLPSSAATDSPAEILRSLYEYEKVEELAKSIARHGFHPTEPLLAIEEDGRHVVVEGNRRLAALKGLLFPTILDPKLERRLQRLRDTIPADEIRSLHRVNVVIAPSRRATDSVVSSRHVGTAVRSWSPENQARFIQEKLQDGYSPIAIRDELGLDMTQIDKVQRRSAIVEVIRGLDLATELKERATRQNAGFITTLERIFGFKPGREFFRASFDADHGLVFKANPDSVRKAMERLVTDAVSAKPTLNSRTVNNSADLRKYLDGWAESERPKSSPATVTPAELSRAMHDGAKGRPSRPARGSSASAKRPRPSKFVIPKSFKAKRGHQKVLRIVDELSRLDRERFPTIGGISIRVLLELATADYLEREGRLKDVREKLRKKKQPKRLIESPSLKDMVPTLKEVVGPKLAPRERRPALKRLTVDAESLMQYETLHDLLHTDLQLSPNEILVFWEGIEPIFREMLSNVPEPSEKE